MSKSSSTSSTAATTPMMTRTFTQSLLRPLAIPAAPFVPAQYAASNKNSNQYVQNFTSCNNFYPICVASSLVPSPPRSGVNITYGDIISACKPLTQKIIDAINERFSDETIVNNESDKCKVSKYLSKKNFVFFWHKKIIYSFCSK